MKRNTPRLHSFPCLKPTKSSVWNLCGLHFGKKRAFWKPGASGFQHHFEKKTHSSEFQSRKRRKLSSFSTPFLFQGFERRRVEAALLEAWSGIARSLHQKFIFSLLETTSALWDFAAWENGCWKNTSHSYGVKRRKRSIRTCQISAQSIKIVRAFYFVKSMNDLKKTTQKMGKCRDQRRAKSKRIFSPISKCRIDITWRILMQINMQKLCINANDVEFN